MDDTLIYFIAVIALINCLFISSKLTAAIKAHRITLDKYDTLIKEYTALLKLLDKE